MTTFVKIKHEETGAVGTCPVKALPIWEAKGFKAVDPDEVEVARKRDNVTADDVKHVEEQAAEGAVYDPSAHTPAEVKSHLLGLDTSTAEGQAEYDRIVAAETRKTALPS